MIRYRLIIAASILLSSNLFAQTRSWEELSKEGQDLIQKSEYALAEPVLLECLLLQERGLGKTDQRSLATRQLLDMIYSFLKLDERREAQLLEHLEIAKTMSELSQMIPIVNLVQLYGVTYKDFSKADSFIVQYVNLARKVEEDNRKQFAKVKNYPSSLDMSLKSAASLYEMVNHNEKAEPLLREALQVAETDLKKFKKNKHGNYGPWLMRCAEISSKLGEYDKTDLFMKECVDVMKATYGENSELFLSAVKLRNFYIAKKTDNNLVPANSNSSEKSSPKDLHDVWGLLTKVSILGSKGQFTEAEVLMKECASVSENIYGPENELTWQVIYGLAVIQLQGQKYTDSEINFSKYFEHLRAKVNRSMPVFSEAEKKAFTTSMVFRNFDLFKPYVLAYHDSLPTLTDQLFNNQLFTKAILLSASTKMRERILNSTPQLKEAFLLWKSKKQNLLNAYNMSIQDHQENGINIRELEAEVNVMEKTLSLSSEDFKSINEISRVRWQDIQQRLGENDAAIEIVRIGLQHQKGFEQLGFDRDTVLYIGLILTKQEQHSSMVILPNGRALETRLAKFYSNSIKSKLADSQSYSHYWGPFSEQLQKVLPRKGKHTIYLSSDGVYSRINVSSLFNPATNKYVQDEYEIRLLTNTKDLLLSKASQGGKDVELFGYPDYESTSSELPRQSVKLNSYDSLETNLEERSSMGKNLTLLPGTKKEIEEIQKALSIKGVRNNIYLKADANESNIKNLQSPRILHIATHGYFMESENIEKQASSGIGKNPLLRSGLFLAGASTSISKEQSSSGEDGILTAYEAMNLNLDKTELVVLSACETGSGEIANGEGVYGLQRAFQMAGAKAVIMSLWKVDDEATQQLMVQFYQYWMENGKMHESFQRAQQNLRSTFPHPYYWGAFVLIGDTD